MKQLLVVGEDDLCCALGEKIASQILDGWHLAVPSISVGGITKLKTKIPRYNQQSKYLYPVLCIADTDGNCPIECLEQLGVDSVGRDFLLRLAEAEAESWLLADRGGFAEAFGVSKDLVPTAVDKLPDPKQTVLTLAARSKTRRIRDEVVSASSKNKRGSGYNLHLCAFARDAWNVKVARTTSSSLERACIALEALRDRFLQP